MRQSVAYPGLDVKVVGTHGGLVGKDGASHHGIEDVSAVRKLPMVCVCPSVEEVGYVLEVTADDKSPTYIRLFRHDAEVKFDMKDFHIETGERDINGNRAKYIRPYRILEGNDVVVFSNGYMLSKAFDACKELKLRRGIDAGLVSVPYVKPFDDDPGGQLMHSLMESKSWVSVEDHRREGGLGSAIAENVVEKLPKRGKIISIPSDRVIGSGGVEELYHDCGLSVERLVESIACFYYNR